MKTLPVLIFIAVASFGIGGCCITPGLHTPQHPAVVIDYPEKKPNAHGGGILDVKLTRHCLSLDAVRNAKYCLDGVMRPFNSLVALKCGEHHLTFPRMEGRVTPPPTTVVVSSTGTTTVTVTYNLTPHRTANQKGQATGNRNHQGQAGRPAGNGAALASAFTIDPTPGTVSLSNQANGLTIARLSVVPGVPSSNSSKWWLNPTSQIPYPYYNMGMGTGGNPTLYFGALTGYNPPNPTQVALARGKTTTVTAYYHLQ